MAITIYDRRAIAGIRRASRAAAATLASVGARLEPGVTTAMIDRWVREDTARRGGRPSQLGYHGFPASVCTSRNDVICHGIPSDDVALRDGDIVNVDVTTELDGFHGDTSATFYIGEPSEDAKRVVETARRCLELGIEQVRPGAYVGDIGAAIQEYAESQGCSVVRDFVGHGIGRQFHMEPSIPHYGTRGKGVKLKAGMVFTIEPMINLGDYETELQADRWTVLTRDRSLSAQFEHTILVTRSGVEVLTTRGKRLVNSEDKPWSALGPLSTPAALPAEAGDRRVVNG
ncbi:MAG: type I methionyl aminopeptidase [Myxococcales bacterium]|nr:type I methionyl aminopeptidase [Myxococcales bacterium]